MSRIVVVSNRGPATVEVDVNGSFSVGHAAGGLAPSLAQALIGSEATWIAAAMTEAERLAAASEDALDQLEGLNLTLLDLAPEVIEAAYSTVANDMLWFLHHNLFDRPLRPVFDQAFHRAWEHYRSYNEQFAEAVARHAHEGATVVVHDYHLSLMGVSLRRLRPDLKTVHFTHTPFCSPDELAMLPDAIADELLSGLAAYGACGFHTARWATAFARCCEAHSIAPPVIFDCPLGSDSDEITGQIGSAEVQRHRAALDEQVAGRQLIFRSDRLELSKNIVRGFLAFEELLAVAPEWRGRVVFLARAYPSRTELEEYRAYRDQVEQVVERINERFSDPAYLPIELVIEDDFSSTLAGFASYDVLLVNPLRDGMNLVAKEGPIANAHDGVLLLSREAGAFAQMAEGALEIEPYDVTGTAAAMLRALEMGAEERALRASRLREAAAALPPRQWLAAVTERAVLPRPAA